MTIPWIGHIRRCRSVWNHPAGVNCLNRRRLHSATQAWMKHSFPASSLGC